MGMKPTVPDDGALQQQIGTAYDVVKSVADALPAIYTVLDAVDTITGSYVLKSTTINGKALTNNITLNADDVGARAANWVPAWADVLNKPTTLAGYGITDAQPVSNLLNTFNINVASATTGFFKKTAANTWSFTSLVAGDIPNLDVGKITTGTLPVARGGTGRTDNKSAALITPVTITIGSTGKSFDGSAAVSWSLTELGAQAVNTNLTAFSGLTGVADRLAYFTGAGTLALTNFTAFGRSVVAATDAAAVNTLLGVQSKADTDLVTDLFNFATYDLNFAEGIYKEYRGKYLYQLPLLDALTCTRNSTATASGPTILNSFDINEPRITYDPATGKRLGLLGEESRTNLLLHSQYTAASGETPPTGWLIFASTGVTTTAASSRFSGAIRATQSGTAQRECYVQTLTLAAATTYTFSAYFVAGTSADNIILRVRSASGDTPTGTLTLPASAVTAAGTYSVTFTTVSGGSYEFYIGLGCSGNATGTVIHETPQLEVGSTATSYIPTTTAQLSRVADICNQPLSITNANAGAIFIEFDLTSYDTSSPNATVIVKLCDSANTNNRGFGLNLSGNQFALRLRDSVISNSASITVSNSLLPKKALISFDLTTGQMLIAIDGISSSAPVTAGIDLSLFVSHLFVHGGTAMTGSTIQHSKTVKRCTYFPRSFTAAEATAITK